MFEDNAKVCLDEAGRHGASYAEARFLSSRTRTATSDGSTFEVQNTSEATFGVRVLADGMWGFAAGTGITKQSCRKVAARAVRIARISAEMSMRKISLIDIPTVKGEYSSNFKKNPFEVEIDEINELLKNSVKLLRNESKRIKSALGSIFAFEEKKYIATSEGSSVFQRTIGCGPSLYGIAIVNGLPQRRSYPSSRGHNISTRGYEAVEEADLLGNSERIGKELLSLINSRGCPRGTTSLIIYGDLLSSHIHETVGHPTESDRAMDTEWDFAGSTFLTPEKRGSFSFASKIVNIVADATIPGGPGSYDFDDELVSGKRVSLIKDGIFDGYQTSRETAKELGIAESSGAMRAMTGVFLPLIRMTNINLEPGDWTANELVQDTRGGILATGASLAIFDQRRRTFIFSGEIGWRIENGELKEVIKNPIYHGSSTDIWQGCDAIAKDGWGGYGTSCGKGRPHQSMRVGHYSSQARFKNMRVGEPA